MQRVFEALRDQQTDAGPLALEDRVGVATVVPCSTSEMSEGAMRAFSQISRTPLATPMDWSSGVDGVLA